MKKYSFYFTLLFIALATGLMMSNFIPALRVGVMLQLPIIFFEQLLTPRNFSIDYSIRALVTPLIAALVYTQILYGLLLLVHLINPKKQSYAHL